MRKYNTRRFARNDVKAQFSADESAAAVESAIADGAEVKFLYPIPSPVPKPVQKGFYSGRRFL